MTTAYTSLLGLALPVTGELSGTWGDTVNNSITSLLDSAIAGTTTLSSDADVTLTTTTGASNTSRQAIILWTAGGTVTRNITAPAQSKIYTVINKSSSTQSIVLRGVGPTTGVTIVQGESAVCAWNGSDFIKISNTSGAGVFTTLSASSTVTLSGGTENGVAYLNGAKVLTTGSALVFDGTNLSTGSGSFFANGTSGITGFRAQTTSNYAEIQSRPDISYSRILSSAYLLDLATLSNQPILFTINSTEAMRLTSTSLYTASTINVGIGLSNPATKMQISAAEPKLRITSTAGSGKSWDISSGGGTTVNAGQFCIYDTTTDAQRFNVVSGTGNMTLDASGNLGIGETSPGAKLEVNQAATAFPGFKITGSNSPGMQIVEATGVTAHFVNDSAGVYVGSSTSYPLIFRTNNTERARFNTTGAFVLAGGTTTADGIGITFPATQSASTNANTLDDYEEGTWTPNQGSGLTVVGAFSSSGTYTKIGSVVEVTGILFGATSIRTGALGLVTTNLPFTQGTGNWIGRCLDSVWASSTDIIVSAANIYSATATTANTYIFFSVTYRV